MVKLKAVLQDWLCAELIERVYAVINSTTDGTVRILDEQFKAFCKLQVIDVGQVIPKENT